MSDKLDARIYLATVLTHIANHVMDEGDVQAWRLVSDRQKEFFSELSQEERDDGHRVIREPKGKCVLNRLRRAFEMRYSKSVD